jgi:xanthine dehydrogenase accessory factor
MTPSIYELMREFEKSGESFVVCTIVNSKGSTPRRTGSKMIVRQNGDMIGSVGGGEVEHRVRQEALDALSNGKAKMLHYQLTDPDKGDPGVCGGELDIFIEPVNQKEKIIIVGAGHVGGALAHLAKWSGFKVAISDDRPEIGTQINEADVDEIWIGSIDQISQHIEINKDCYLVLTTRSAELDMEGLPGLMALDPGYIGVIGSKRRWAVTRAGLINNGMNEALLERIHTPVGLKIGAETPEEIAVSIMAEIIQIKHEKAE